MRFLLGHVVLMLQDMQLLCFAMEARYLSLIPELRQGASSHCQYKGRYQNRNLMALLYKRDPTKKVCRSKDLLVSRSVK